MLRDSCWICGSYREHRFFYALLERDVRAVWRALENDSASTAAARQQEVATKVCHFMLILAFR